MILRKVRGPQFHLPIGKIKIECIHEVLLAIITNHPLSNESWNTVVTDNTDTVIAFLYEFLEISTGPLCSELGMYLNTVMAILNRVDYKIHLSKHFMLFSDILDNLQLNPNNSCMCKCTVFKLPSNLPFILPHKLTTYYCFIEIEKLTDSPSELFKFTGTKLEHSKCL